MDGTKSVAYKPKISKPLHVGTGNQTLPEEDDLIKFFLSFDREGDMRESSSNVPSTSGNNHAGVSTGMEGNLA